jgi:starvation-inducible DNA-binding protein
VTLGGRAFGTARHVAAASRLPEYPREASGGMEHVGLLAERIEAYLAGVRGSRETAARLADDDTVDLLTRIVADFEKHAWFLRASLEP